jgi:hypothetical protein
VNLCYVKRSEKILQTALESVEYFIEKNPSPSIL